MSSIQLGAINFLTLAGQTRGRWRGVAGRGGDARGLQHRKAGTAGQKKVATAYTFTQSVDSLPVATLIYPNKKKIKRENLNLD